MRILPSSTVPGDLDFIKILCFLAAGWVSYHDDYSTLRNEPRVTSVGMSGHTTPERFGRLGPPGSATFPEFRLQNSVPERSRSRFDAAETPKRVPEDPFALRESRPGKKGGHPRCVNPVWAGG